MAPRTARPEPAAGRASARTAELRRAARLASAARRLGRRVAKRAPVITFDRAFLFAYLAGLCALMAGLTITHFARAYSSDDVVLQTIMGFWLQGYHGHTYLGSDSYVLKLPLFAAANALVADPRDRLLVTVLVLNAIGYTLFALACRSFWRPLRGSRCRLAVLSLVWVAVLGYPFYVVLITPNARNLEIGAAFLILALFARYLRGDFPERSLRFGLAAAGFVIFLGLFFYDDPFFLYFLAIPLALALVSYDILTGFERRHLYLVGYLALSVVAFAAWTLLFRAFGIYTPSNAGVRFIRLDQVGSQLTLLAESWVQLFQANFFGQPVISTAAIRSFLVLSFLFVILAYPVYLSRHARFRSSFWKYFLAAIPWFSIAAFGTSYTFDIIGGKRYLVLVPFAAAITAGFLYENLTARRFRVLFAGLLAANILVGIYSMRSYALAMQANPNADTGSLIAAVAQQGLTKGYTDYWIADLSTYLANGQIDFISVDCASGSIELSRALNDDGILAKPAARSFFVYDSAYPGINGCDMVSLLEQFGPPAQVVPLGPTRQLLIYDYDIGSKL